MYYFLCVIIGYIIGSISPSYILGKIKKIDLRNSGTKNLGASNTFIHMGRGWGIFVMLFDIFKALCAVLLCRLLFHEMTLSGIVAGASCVLGHNYPFYLGFKGGKGLASYGGFVLGVSPVLFLILLAVCLLLAFIFNYGCLIALSAAVLFPVLVGLKFGSLSAFLITAVCSVSVFLKHTENIKRIRCGEENKFRSFIGKYVMKDKNHSH